MAKKKTDWKSYCHGDRMNDYGETCDGFGDGDTLLPCRACRSAAPISTLTVYVSNGEDEYLTFHGVLSSSIQMTYCGGIKSVTFKTESLNEIHHVIGIETWTAWPEEDTDERVRSFRFWRR